MGTPTQRLQVKKKVIKSPTSFFEYPFNNTAHYHVLKRYNFSCYSFCKNILKYLSRMGRVSLSTAERSMFLPVRTVSDVSGLCKCSIEVPFVVWELTVNNNNNNHDILIHFLQRKRFNLQMHRLLVHLDTCIYLCLLFFGTRLTVYSYRH